MSISPFLSSLDYLDISNLNLNKNVFTFLSKKAKAQLKKENDELQFCLSELFQREIFFFLYSFIEIVKYNSVVHLHIFDIFLSNIFEYYNEELQVTGGPPIQLSRIFTFILYTIDNLYISVYLYIFMVVGIY